jgi:hypothetical protein
MTAVTNYTTLIAAVLEEMDDTSLTDYVPGWIGRAEALFNRRLYSLDTEATATASLTSVATTASLPTGYKAMISIRLGNLEPLTYLAPEDFQAKWHEAPAALPDNWTIIGGVIRFGPAPDTAYTANMNYVSTLTGLSGSNATNWIVTAHPDLYLDATLAYAERHKFNWQAYGLYLASAEKHIAEINAYDARRKRSNSVDTVAAEYF